jgi:hypothetical protein
LDLIIPCKQTHEEQKKKTNTWHFGCQFLIHPGRAARRGGWKYLSLFCRVFKKGIPLYSLNGDHQEDLGKMAITPMNI